MIRIGGIAIVLLAASAAPAQVLFSETFDGNAAGWTLGPQWQVGPATASPGGAPPFICGDPGTDGAGVLGGGVAGIVIGGNPATTAPGSSYLTSPTIPINPGLVDAVVLKFDRWLNSGSPPFMTSAVEVYSSLGWLGVFNPTGPVADCAWHAVQIDVTEHMNPLFSVRFRYGTSPFAPPSAGSWNVDNVHVVATPAAPAAERLVEKFNGGAPGWVTSGLWQIGAATASPPIPGAGSDPSFDADGVPGGGVAGVALGGNFPGTPVAPPIWLTSPPVDLSGATGPAYVSFDRWLNSTNQLEHRIEAFNGAGWVHVFSLGFLGQAHDTAWTPQRFDVTAHKNATFRLRFGVGSTSWGATAASSWNVDNVRIGAGIASSAAITSPCGASLTATTPFLGDLSFVIVSGPPNSGGLMLIGGQTPPVLVAATPCSIDVAPTWSFFFFTDAVGGFVMPNFLPLDPVFDGVVADLQALFLPVTGFVSSNVQRVTLGVVN